MTIEVTSNRTAIKNPFAKIHQAAIDNGGSLPDAVRKKMMREAIEELHQKKQALLDVEDKILWVKKKLVFKY